MTRRVLVVGAGVVGLCTAYSLRQRGVAVAVLEAGVPGAGASSGNAGWIVPSVATPLPAPGLGRTALRWMLGASGPLSIRPRLDPALARWLWTFWRSCSPEAYARGLAATAELNREAVRLYEAMWAGGVRFELHREGVILLYLQDAAREKDGRALEALGVYGFARPHPLDGDALRRLEPSLSAAVRSGLWLPGERMMRPESLVAGLVEHLRGAGVEVLDHAPVTGFRTEGRRVVAVETPRGSLQSDAVVIAAGAWTPALTARLGVRLPIQAGQGYHLDYVPPPVKIRHGLLLADAKVVVTPTEGCLRLTGVMDVARPDDRRVRPARARAVAEAARRYLEGWPEDLQPTRLWAGPRPIAADGLPVIGRLPTCDNAYVASGHHMAGMLMGPATGDAVAELIVTGRGPAVIAPFDPARFA